MGDLNDEYEGQGPIWPVFGDLMAGVLGVFVLLLVWALGFQVELAQTLKAETELREKAEQRRLALEKALEQPLASGRISLTDGRIEISGSVLFAINSAELQDEGLSLLQSLVTPLQFYLQERDEILMVSGFTDDLPIQRGNLHFVDNWELSAQRSLTVTRALISNGLSPSSVFSAAFADQQPVVPNVDSESRAQNRRVEIAPVARSNRALSDRSSLSADS